MANSERVEFTGAFGDRLAARLEWPSGPVQAFAIFAHCFSCSKDILAASRISRRLARAGIAVLRFDFTGLGQSEGDFSNSNFSSNISDLVAASDFLEERFQAPALLIGHSLGGAAVIAAAGRLPAVKAVATIGAPADVAHVRQQFKADVETIRRDGEGQVFLAGRPFTIRRQFLVDLDGHAIEDAVTQLKRPLLIAHAPADETVGIDNASRLFQAAKHPKSFVSVDGADHLLSSEAASLHVADMIAAWAQRYIAPAEQAVGFKPIAGRVLVEESGHGRFHNHVLAGEHILTADEPREMGGDDGGPSPYQLLSASLGACTSMTLRMYADRKGWPLKRTRVSIAHEKARDGKSGDPVDRFDRELVLEGPLDAEQTARLLEIADMCPVHRTLHGQVEVTTRLVPGT